MTKNQQNNTEKRGLNSKQLTKEIKFINNCPNKEIKIAQKNKEKNNG